MWCTTHTRERESVVVGVDGEEKNEEERVKEKAVEEGWVRGTIKKESKQYLKIGPIGANFVTCLQKEE